EAAGEGVEAEEGGQLVDDAFRFLEGGFFGRAFGFELGGEASIEEEGTDAESGVEQEHDVDRLLEGDAGVAVDAFRQAGGESAEGGDERADEAVAGEEVGAFPVADGAREESLFGGEKDADVAGRGVEGAEEGDEQEGPEVVHEGEGESGEDGEHRAA